MARILIVEDSESMRTMLRLILAHFGHEVTEARNGKEGLLLFKQLKIDLVITDIVMPEKDGIELVQELLQKQRQPVKVIAISGAGGPQTASRYLRMAELLGASMTLVKPFSDKALAAAVNAQLSSGEAAGD